MAMTMTTLVGPKMVLAQSSIDSTIKGLGNTASEAGLIGQGQNAPDLLVIVGNFIQTGLGLLGVAFLLIAIYAGAQMLVGEEAKKLTAARSILVNALIGMVIIFSAYAISSFVIDQVGRSSGVLQGGTSETTTGGFNCFCDSTPFATVDSCSECATLVTCDAGETASCQ